MREKRLTVACPRKAVRTGDRKPRSHPINSGVFWSFLETPSYRTSLIFPMSPSLACLSRCHQAFYFRTPQQRSRTYHHHLFLRSKEEGDCFPFSFQPGTLSPSERQDGVQLTSQSMPGGGGEMMGSCSKHSPTPGSRPCWVSPRSQHRQLLLPGLPELVLRLASQTKASFTRT